MNRKTANVYLWSLFFFANLNFLPAISEIDEDNNKTLVANKIILEENITKDAVNIPNEGKILETDNLEPSIDIQIDSITNEINSKTEKSAGEDLEVLSQIIGHNNSPFVTTPESLTRDVDRTLDIPLMVSSRNEVEHNVIAQIENIPEDNIRNITDTLNENVEKDVGRNVLDEKSEEIPSFSEWAQKRLEEVEKTQQINSSKKGVVNGKTPNAKMRWKNYASLDCGAKVIAANPEAVSPGAILSLSIDEYKLNPCTSKIWFVVELCEVIQIKRIDLANYELFSSSPKEFTVMVSERYPTRDWSFVGKFTANDERDIQTFDFDSEFFGKYIKVEIKSHYGSEHYCPISLFRAYGTSVFEVLQKDDPTHEIRDDDDEEADDDSEISTSGHPHKNLFNSAKDAVISMVKRAAEALGNKVDNQTSGVEVNDTTSMRNLCNSPRHMIVCNNCNDTLFAQIYDLLSCKTRYIHELVSIPAIYKVLINSFSCRSFGLDFKTNFSGNSSYVDNLQTFFPEKYVGAMCNEVALMKHPGSLNITQQYLNITKKLTKEKIISLDVTSTALSVDVMNQTLTNIDKAIDETLNVNVSELDTILLAHQIKPTKVFTSEPKVDQTMNGSNVQNESDKTVETASKPEEEISVPSENSIGDTTNTITVVQVPEIVNVTESSDNLDDNIDNIISSDINVDTQGTVAPSAASASLPQAPKESIFLRLSNRIKALERNMSLSSQYLEELSKRYKKQVEEMQVLLEKTLTILREENVKANDRQRHFEERLNQLTTNMENLLGERQVLLSVLYMSVIIILVSFCLYFFCGKRQTRYGGGTEKRSEVLRRSSVGGFVEKPQQEKRMRRPSDQMLKIVRYSSLQEDDKARKSRKKKKSRIERSNSTSSLKRLRKPSTTKRPADWVDQNRQAVEDIPFPLEESDLCIYESFSTPKSDLGNESPKSDTSQNFFENVDSLPKYINGTEEANVTSSFNNSSKSDIISLSEPVKKEKRSFKKLLKKVF